MRPPSSLEGEGLPDPRATGEVCAALVLGQRDLQQCAARYGELFPADPFDASVFSAIAAANAFSAPWLSADELRLTNRTTLWAFALDRAVDELARTSGEINDLVDRCLDVSDRGAVAATDPLTTMLGELREDLLGGDPSPPHPSPLHKVWQQQLHRMLAAMAREWEWNDRRRAGDPLPLPTVPEYLDNADNLGLAFVYVSFWLSAYPTRFLDRVDELLAACAETQKVVRLINDLSTLRRDLRTGDVNVLLLGVDRPAVVAEAQRLTASTQALLRSLTDAPMELVAYLDRLIGFNFGFHPVTDYWGEK